MIDAVYGAQHTGHRYRRRDERRSCAGRRYHACKAVGSLPAQADVTENQGQQLPWSGCTSQIEALGVSEVHVRN
jgi:hypothetical protein